MSSRHDRDGAVTRRQFLGHVGRIGIGAAALGAFPAWTRQAIAAGQGASADLIVRNDYPEHWETTIAALGRDWITPNERFFVRSHFFAPDLPADRYRLEIAGLVSRPETLTLGEVRALPTVTRTVTLECAGNGRGLFRLPSTSGTQWEYGAVGNAEWSGPSLAALLQRAGVAPEAKHVWFECGDAPAFRKVPKFVRSIPIDKAMRDVLMAHTMNGAPLPKLHGAPLRAIVPGWYGMASSKWVTRIRLEDRPSDNHFMVKGYRYVPPGGDPTAAPPVDELRVKSLITSVAAGGAAAPFRASGFAWAGRFSIKRVDVSLDQGKTWLAARLEDPYQPDAWRRWRFEQPGVSGKVVWVRATDEDGVTQPVSADLNTGGYGNNSIHHVAVAR